MPMPEALVAVEVGGIYRTDFDAAVNPYYQHGVIADNQGAFSVRVPPGQLGLHTYSNDYSYGVGAIMDDCAPNIVVTPKHLLPADEANKPTATGFTVTPANVAPGATLTLSAHVVAGPACKPRDDGGTCPVGSDICTGGQCIMDPLSDEIIAIEPDTAWGALLLPPAGRGSNGVYTLTTQAPSTPGPYTYYLVVASEGCVTSDRLSAAVTVVVADGGGPDAPTD
jgi:hypothetical protein